MKLIKAFVRSRRMDEVIRTLETARAPGITVSCVHGVGVSRPRPTTLPPAGGTMVAANEDGRGDCDETARPNSLERPRFSPAIRSHQHPTSSARARRRIRITRF
jgi:hypothetical protein